MDKNKQIKQKYPMGMKLILIMLGGGTLILLFSLFKTPVAQFGPVLLTGSAAVFVNIIVIGILSAIFYGVLKRLEWGRKLAIYWYSFSMLLSLVNFISFISNKTMYDNFYQKILTPEVYAVMTTEIIVIGFIQGLIFGCIIGITIILYLIKKKDFFVK